MGRTYTSVRGKEIDMEKLFLRNEQTPAVGNMRVNARGDEIGEGGKVTRTREQVLQDFYAINPAASKEEVVSRKKG
jgi:hypothetical protein|tara:strand:- start:1195 stop:1422 length:228 start_codon:yes stop_codon:yes gene_type:complete